MNHIDLPDDFIPRPPIVPKAYRPTSPALRNPDWVEASENQMYCMQHHIYWTSRFVGGCSKCAEDKDVAAMQGTDSHASPDMRPKLVGENNHMQEVWSPCKNHPTVSVAPGRVCPLCHDGGEVRVTDEITGGQKGSKPETLGFVDPLALLELARVAGFGANKYAPFNYLKGFDWSLSYNALQRHILLFMSGEDRDSESGYLHMAHAAWHCLALMSFSLRKLGNDDRPPK